MCFIISLNKITELSTRLSHMLLEKIDACLQCSLSTRLSHMQDLPFWLLWRLWKSRNTLIFQQKEIDWRSLLRYAREDATEWKQRDSKVEEIHTRRRSCMISVTNIMRE